MPKRALLLTALALALAAPTASAASLPPNGVPNGTYSGYDWATNTVFTAIVKNNYIFGASYYTQLFSGTPGNLVPGTSSSSFGNINGSSGASPGYKIASNGNWALFSDIPPGEGPNVPTICGNTKFQTKLVASWNCTGPGGTMSGNPQFSAQTTQTPGVASGVYSGQVQTSPVPGNPNAPWTGTEGPITITYASGTLTGSATLAPVDPNTGLLTGPPSVNVTYGPVVVGGEASEGNFVTASGTFGMVSNPSGYNIAGGFLPAGITGLPAGGMVAGTVNTFPPKFNGSGFDYGPAIAGSFQIFGPGS
jgi:hypothetical protein